MKTSIPVGNAAAFLFLSFVGLLASPFVNGQCKPSIKVDSKITVVNEYDDFGLRLPLWLRAGQTLSVASSVNSISVIEFVENGSALEYSQVLSITSDTPVEVPSGRVWKVESVVKENNSSSYRSATFGSGTFTWTVPACAEQICIEAWGGGGSGSSTYYPGTLTGSKPGAGGGGGGFGSECFTVVPGTQYQVIVGEGGNGTAGASSSPFGFNGLPGGDTSVGSLIIAYGGSGGIFGSTGGTGGAGGTSPAASNAQGATGKSAGNVINYSQPSGSGGAGGNGGAGGAPTTGHGAPGTAPGGGGSGSSSSTGNISGKGGDGKVIITW